MTDRSLFLRPSWRRGLLVAVTTGVALGGLTACNQQSEAGSASASEVEACEKKVDAYLEDWETLPTDLPASPPGPYVPLENPVKAGLKVVSLVVPVPAATTSSKELAAAAKTVGWTSQIVNFDGSVPDLITKFEQALAGGADVIWIQGIPAGAIQKQIDDAKDKGVLVALSSAPDEPVSNPGLGVVTNSIPNTTVVGELSAHQFARTAGCDGSVVTVTLPFPILENVTKSFEGTVEDICPSCKTSQVLVQPQDIGTPEAIGSIVSALQADPTIKNVYSMTGDLVDGLVPALRQAGLDDVKVFGVTPDESSFAALRDGSNEFWVNLNSPMQGWTAFDGILRALDSGEVFYDTGHYPLSLLTKDNMPDGTDDVIYPADFREKFAALWGAEFKG